MKEGMEAFGDRLRRLRVAAALSQEELAERTGLSRRGISDLERGARRVPRFETVRMLADGLALDDDARTALLAAARPALHGTAVGTTVDRTHPVLSAVGRISALSAAARPPLPPTPLVGRDAEVARVLGLLTGEARLVTLTGPGGTGKTRLALEVACRFAEATGHSVVFVDLAPVRDHDLLLSTVALALGVRETDRAGLHGQVRSALARQPTLLLLDNVEHLLPGAPLVAALLSDVPILRVLATSRARLHLRAEVDVEVPPLPAADAVTLFVSHATTADSMVTLTPVNASIIGEICRRLDHLPLAIELAAARIRLLPPEAFLARLTSRLSLLTGGAADLPDRQRTLRDTIGWSYGLLAPAEQRLFRQLAVFVGGWALDNADAVCGVDGAVDVLDGLSALLDGSLVRRQAGDGRSPRFGMLETIREYALEAFEASGEATAIRAAHAARYVLLAEQMAPQIDASGNVEGLLAWFDAELPNLRAALVWLQERGDGEGILRLVSGVDELWMLRPYLDEARRWVETGLALAPAAPAEVRARAWCTLALVSGLAGDPGTALEAADQGFAIAEDLGDAVGRARARFAHGVIHEQAGNHGQAATAYGEAAGLLLSTGLTSWAGWALGAELDQRLLSGTAGDTRAALAEAFRLVDEGGYAVGRATVACQCGYAACAAGDPAAAGAWFRRGLTEARAIGVVRLELGAAAGLAAVALDGGDAVRAVRLLGAIDAARVHAGLAAIALGEQSRRTAERARTALDDEAFAQAWAEGLMMPWDEAAREVEAPPG